MQIWGKYESKGQYMKVSNKKKIIEMIKNAIIERKTASACKNVKYIMIIV